MSKNKIRYTKDAVDDLDGIFDYISENNLPVARNMLHKIITAIEMLTDNPRLGTILPVNDLSLVEPGYRKLVVNPYIIFYRIGKNEIYIARVLHGKQDWLYLLFQNDYTTI